MKHRIIAGFGLLLLLVAGCEGLRHSRSGGGIAEFDLARVTRIVAPASLLDDAAYAVALGDLRDLLETRFGARPEVAGDDAPGPLPPHSIIIGGTRNRWTAGMVAPATANGFVLRTAAIRGAPVLTVAGADLLGDVYGLLHLVERARLDESFTRGPVELARQPAFALRASSSPLIVDGTPIVAGTTSTNTEPRTLEDFLRQGYNTVFLWQYFAPGKLRWSSLPLYDGFDPRIYSPATQAEARAWAEDNRAVMRAFLAKAKRLHLTVGVVGDVFEFPRQVFEMYGDEITHDDGSGKLCAARPKVWELLRAGVDEVLTDFPEIDILVVRTGENYASGMLAGNGPQVSKDRIGKCSLCRHLDYVERLRMVANRMHEVVVDAHRRVYIQRTWDLPPQYGYVGGLHTDPEMYARLMAGIPQPGSMLLSVKQTGGDFWRYMEPNRTLGLGSIPQIVELLNIRSFEGKGAYPNYLGGIMAADLRRVKGLGLDAAWVWNFADGAGGPRLGYHGWNRAASYVTSRLLWQPEADPARLVHDWALLEFGPAAAPYVADAYLMSDAALTKLLYVKPYSETHRTWAPNEEFVSFGVIRGDARMRRMYDACKDRIPEVMAEKDAGLAAVDRMIERLQSARAAGDSEPLGHAENSIRYLRSYGAVIRDYFGATFWGWHARETGNAEEAARARQYAAAWRESWRVHREEIPRLPGASSAYQDAGMVKTVAEAAPAP